MHVTALPRRFRQALANGLLESVVVVGDDELDAMKTSLLEADQEIPPTRPALAVRKLHTQDLPPPFPVDADRDQNRLRLNHVIHPHLFVTRVEDQIRKRLTKPPARKAGELVVELLHDRRNRRR